MGRHQQSVCLCAGHADLLLHAGHGSRRTRDSRVRCPCDRANCFSSRTVPNAGSIGTLGGARRIEFPGSGSDGIRRKTDGFARPAGRLLRHRYRGAEFGRFHRIVDSHGPLPRAAGPVVRGVQARYAGIESQQIWVASVSLNAFRAQHLDPHTGLTAGFLKALARELPGSTLPHRKHRREQFEHGSAPTGGGIRAVVRRIRDLLPGRQAARDLAEKVERLSDASGPALDASSVVLATGGGRGVTAVLAEELLTRFGCTVIALGRTDPASAPPHILAMDEAQLVQYEAQFYKEQIARGTGKKIIELKKEFKNYQSVLEVSQTVRRLSALPGRFEYISTDPTDEQSVAAIVNPCSTNTDAWTWFCTEPAFKFRRCCRRRACGISRAWCPPNSKACGIFIRRARNTPGARPPVSHSHLSVQLHGQRRPGRLRRGE
jgi:hypothetical protein